MKRDAQPLASDAVIRGFTRGDVDFAIARCALEGWTTSRRWFELFLSLDPAGSLIAEVDSAPVGLITAIRYARTAWIGNLLVSPDCRRHGIGTRLMCWVLGQITAAGIATVRLDADPPGMNIYRRLGFVEEFESLRFCRRASRASAPTSAVPLTASSLDAVATLDHAVFGDDRSPLIRALFGHAEAALSVSRDDAIAGYVLVIPTTTGVHIGPCVAEDASIAAELLRGALHAGRGRSVTIGMPASNRAGAALLRSLGFAPTAPSVRMVRGRATHYGTPERVFAVVSGAFG